MMGPDYTWWKGIYEVGKHFYFKFLPAAQAYNDPEVNQYITRLLTNNPMHNWMNQTTDQLKQKIKSGEMKKIYKNMFEETQATDAPGNQ